VGSATPFKVAEVGALGESLLQTITTNNLFEPPDGTVYANESDVLKATECIVSGKESMIDGTVPGVLVASDASSPSVDDVKYAVVLYKF
jgi:hypothetical protein